MESLERLFREHGPVLVFVNVLLERLGVPIPAMPTMIVGGGAAAPLAGVMRMDWPRFLLLTAAGSALWAGLSIGAGVLFRRQVDELLDHLRGLGLAAALAVGALLAAYIALKWWERQRFYKSVRMARITVD